jgi:small GTP-binding protein
MSIDNPNTNTIKLILVGDTGTGKTNLISVTAGFGFNTNSLTTTSCSYIQKVYTKNGKEYKINLWDTIGQEKYRSLTKIFIKDSKIVIYAYDITNKDSFESLKYWKSIIDNILGDDIITGVVGNKIDLYLNEQVEESEGRKYAEEIGAKFLLTSAKISPNEFSDFIGDLLDDYLSKNQFEIPRKESVSLRKRVEVKKNNKWC